MKERISKSALISAIVLIIATLPIVFLRDLNPVNELNYIAIAHKALADGTIFAFYKDNLPYTDKPPLYLWLAMIGVYFFGNHPSAFIQLCSVIPFAGLILIMDKYFGVYLKSTQRSYASMALCGSLFLLFASVLARMDMLFTFFIILTVGIIAKRTILLVDERKDSTYGEFTIPLFMFLGIFVKGPYAFIFPLVTLFFVLLVKRSLSYYFKIFKPKFFLIILGFIIIWAIAVLLDGGIDYAKNLFVYQTTTRISGSQGHPESAFYYLINFWYLSLPTGFAFVYLFLKLLLKRKLSSISTHSLFAILLPLSILLIITIPSSKLEIYLLPAIPTLSYAIALYLDKGNKFDFIFKVLIALGILPFTLLFPISYFLKQTYPLLDNLYITAAFLLLMLVSIFAIIRVFLNDTMYALAAHGVGLLIMIFVAGFSFNQINPYIGVAQISKQLSDNADKYNNYNVCTVGLTNDWAINLFDGRLIIVESNINDIYANECKNSNIIIGRRALKDNPQIKEELINKGGKMIGDNLLYSPHQ